MSTGDAEELTRLRGKGLLDVGAGKGDLLGDSIERELNKLEEPHKPVGIFMFWLRFWKLSWKSCRNTIFASMRE
jgi:hypothetical protein